MTANGYVETTWQEVPTPQDERPRPRRFAIGPYTATFEVPGGGGLRPGVRATVEGTDGTGTAWIPGEPTSLAMHLGGVEARAGERTILLRRNRPALRRRDRIVSVTGRGVDLRIRSDRHATEITDIARGQVIWRRTRDREQLREGMHPDDVALLLLLVYAQVPQSASSWSILRYV